jgi:hypothetical protein
MDSAENKPQAETPPETSIVLVKNKDGTLREAIRGAGGTFVKKQRPLIPAVEFTRQERKALATLRAGGKDNEYMVMFRSMLKLAQYEPQEGETWDAKMAMAKVKAAEWIRLSALGKPSSSEQDLDRITTQPVTAIFVQAPPIMNPEIVDGDKAVTKPIQPSFAEVTGFTTNPKK